MEKWIVNQNVRIWTTSQGHGTPLILCNGGPGCDDYLEPVSQILESACQVVRFEPRGCGRSDYDGQYDLQTTLEDIECIRTAYSFEKIIIGGHSAGVDVALAYTLENAERVSGMIGLSGGRIVNDRKWHQTYRENLEKVGESYGGKEFVADPKVNVLGNQSWREYITRPTLLHDISCLDVPAVFINGENDIRPSWPTQQLAYLISNGVYREIQGAAHCLWLTHGDALKKELFEAIDHIQKTASLS